MFNVNLPPDKMRQRQKEDAAAEEFNGLFPSEFTASWMYMPHKGDLLPFSFKDREYLIPIYDTPARRMLLLCARQTEKSTTLGAQMLAYSYLRPFFHSLYVSPTETQTSTFSRDKIATPIKNSWKLKAFKGKPSEYADNVLFKEFLTQADITMRYAYLHADRCRGISADLLCLDELQDLLVDVIPIIEEALSHSDHQILRYAGTPKSFDNTISWYWESFSSKNELMIPCECCNHWNLPGIKNIGKKSLICSKCGKQIYAANPRTQWASARSPDWLRNPRDGKGESLGEYFEGYRISQLTVPWIKWSDILDKKTRYGEAQFTNEVLGQAFDSADKLLNKTDLIPHCSPDRRLVDGIKFKGKTQLYMGIDWGGYGQTQTSFTVVSIAGYLGGKFTYIYFRRYTAAEADTDFMVSDIIRTARQFGVVLIGTDYGGGLQHNRRLIQEFGLRRIFRYQYVGTKLLYFDKALSRFMTNRTVVMMAFVNAILAGHLKFPKWEEVEHPFMGDLMSLFREYDSKQIKVNVQRTAGSSDDTAHSALYCLLASMITHPRPDILTPIGDM